MTSRRDARRRRVDVLAEAEEPSACPLCERPNLHPTDHHMVPRSRGGRTTTTLCRDCHAAVHAHFTNKELEAQFNSVEALLGDERFRRTIAFIKRQDPRRKTKTRRPKDKLVRGRSG